MTVSPRFASLKIFGVRRLVILGPNDIGYDTEFLVSGLYLGFFEKAGEPAGYHYWYREIVLNGLSNLDAAARSRRGGAAWRLVDTVRTPAITTALSSF